MSYTPTVFTDNQAPGISAAELNKFGNGIKEAADKADSNDGRLDSLEPRVTKNEGDIAAFVAGEVMKGAFTPTAGSEYPTAGANWSYYISNVAENGYTYIGGTLIGKTAQNMDKIIYTAAGWSLIENNLTVSIPNGAIGNINNPILDLPLNNSLALKQGVGSVTFTRASTATYIDRYGVLKTAANDEVRFEKDGLLIEGASTNICLYSEEFNNAVWNKVGLTQILANLALAPDETLTSDGLVDTAVNTTHYVSQSHSVAAGASYTFSVFVKKANQSEVYLDVGNTYFAGGANARFDLINGTILNEGSDVINASIISLNSEWYRVSFSAVATGTGSNLFYIYASKNGSATYAGGANTALYLWGSQIENLPFATSYISTTIDQVARIEDSCKTSFNDNFPNIRNSSTIILDYISKGNNVDNQDLFTSYLNTSNSFRLLFRGESGFVQAVCDEDNIVSFNLISSSINPVAKKVRIAFVLNETNVYLYADGVLIGQDVHNSDVKINNLLNTDITIGGGVNNCDGNISNIRTYDRALTAEEIAIS